MFEYKFQKRNSHQKLNPSPSDNKMVGSLLMLIWRINMRENYVDVNKSEIEHTSYNIIF